MSAERPAAAASASAPAAATTATATKPTTKPRGVLHYLGLGLSIGLLALMLFIALVTIIIPKVSGATPMTVLTASMEPKLPPGTLIVVKPEPLKKIHIGDVMTYQIQSGNPAVISHRVIAINYSSTGARTFVTKGDNNSNPDPVVTGVQVRGVLWYSVPWIGFVNTAINGGERTWIVPAIALGLFGYAAYMIASGTVGSMRKRREAADKVAEEA